MKDAAELDDLPEKQSSRVVTLFCLVVFLSVLGCQRQEARPVQPSDAKVATFALGCYWCAQQVFDDIEGVVSVTAGYAGEGEDRREAVEVVYDDDLISYERLLDLFWTNIDPLDAGGQFCDRGSSYRAGIFVHDRDQSLLAESSKRQIELQEGIVVVTEILKRGSFNPVMDSEQYYYDKRPVQYRLYRTNCGRDARLYELWGDRAGGGVTH